MALAPEALVRFRAEQDAKRETETATLDRQTQLETLRQEGQDKREDRRDARTQMQIRAQDERANRRLEATGGLTLPQQRTNESIIAARRQLTGMSADEVRRRTTSTDKNGRENPDYDPQLARLASTASSRLYGDDPAHDQFTAGPRQPAAARQPASKATPKQAALAAMSADPRMQGHKLGNQTAKGFEILDSNGVLVGHYQRKSK